jgi:hypothetical protein
VIVVLLKKMGTIIKLDRIIWLWLWWLWTVCRILHPCSNDAHAWASCNNHHHHYPLRLVYRDCHFKGKNQYNNRRNQNKNILSGMFQNQRLMGWSYHHHHHHHLDCSPDNTTTAKLHPGVDHSTNDATAISASSASATTKVMDPTTNTTTRKIYDLSSPREWLEYQEAHSGTAGAYTVLRCEYFPTKSMKGTSITTTAAMSSTSITWLGPWKIWGSNFHWQRLHESYTELVGRNQPRLSDSAPTKDSCGSDKDDNGSRQPPPEANVVLDKATQRSKEMMTHLLAEAANHLSNHTRTTQLSTTTMKVNKSKEKEESSIIVMVTLLWEPATATACKNTLNDNTKSIGSSKTSLSSSTTTTNMIVHGHVCTNELIQYSKNYNPEPMVVSVALPSNKSLLSTSLQSLPNRYNASTLPLSKLSSWCRQRRPLEEQYKSDTQTRDKGAVVIGEVLLVQKEENEDAATNRYLLLEGLTSNLFVVYPGGRIRTPSEGVLHGVARQLILTALGNVNLDTSLEGSSSSNTCSVNHIPPPHWTIETGPIPLDDALLWQEVFVTSAVRLIAPVQQILVQTNEAGQDDNTHDNWAEIWSWKKPLEEEEPCSIWRTIYMAVLHQSTLE